MAQRSKRRSWKPSPIWIVGPLAVLTALYTWQGGPPVHALPEFSSHPFDRGDAEFARFARCGSGPRETCVIDGDTFYYRGTKIRMLDINTPETHGARCSYEKELGDRATERLVSLLNSGPFTLEAEVDNETDRYGRALRRVTRAGQPLGDTLVAEGLAEPWRGYRRNWC